MHRSIRSATILLALAGIPFSLSSVAYGADQESSVKTYDVVIAGAGTGGISAAIQAARLGSKVALLEETDWIGGQMAAAGVGTMDEGKSLTPPSGLYAEFVNRMDAYYHARHKSVGTCYWQADSHCYDPSAIREILNGMIDDANSASARHSSGHIDLLLRERVVRVISTGDVVQGVVTASHKTMLSKIVIDATEFGDILPLTPARYRSGHAIGEDQTHQCTQSITYTVVIRKYPNGVPPELQMHHEPPGYQHWLPQFRAALKPEGTQKYKPPVGFASHNAYRGLPDKSNPYDYVGTESEAITRTSLNWFNDLPVNTSIYQRDARRKFICEAKLKTLANLYYIQQTLGESQWSVANDEGYDTAYNREENSCPEIPQEYKAIEANFPPMPYVRESRRIIGEYTLTAADIRRVSPRGPSFRSFEDAIAVGDYPDDLHNCKAGSDLEQGLDSLSDLLPDFRFGPFQVPVETLIPEKVDGLLAAEKNISESRLVNGATRLQPITMLTGQAAGALAALAVSSGKQPREVAPIKVQLALLQAGSILVREPMPDLTIGSVPWQAAQFAVARKWVAMETKLFEPKKRLTHAEGAAILVSAFSLRKSVAPEISGSESSLTDSEQTSPSSAEASSETPMEALRSAGVVLPCRHQQPGQCEDEVLPLDDLIKAIGILTARASGAKHLDELVIHQEISEKKESPATRGDAAIALLNSARFIEGHKKILSQTSPTANASPKLKGDQNEN